MTARIAIPRGDDSLGRHVLALQRRGTVVVATAETPAAALGQHLLRAGVAASSLVIVDAVTPLAAMAQPPVETVFLGDPTRLDLFASRIEKAARLHAARHVVVDSVTALLRYNTEDDVDAFVRDAALRLGAADVGVDFVLDSGSDRMAARMKDAIAGLVTAQ